jgi:alkylation response protein AidB-like acyl-CoA dehydrogenase
MTAPTSENSENTESVEEFRLRARTWLAGHLPRLEDVPEGDPADSDAPWLRARELQKILWAGGFAGICFPVEYGGLGLGPEYQRAFTQECAGYEMPLPLNVPTLAICAPAILDTGSEELKREHLGAVLRGEEVLVQMLSEPSGGSDLAGLLTRAERDGDSWVLNGAKTWSSGAYGADYGLCLARTDPDVPKHAGLTMFLVPTRAPGITMNRVRMVDGSDEFCEEFFDDVRVPGSLVVGEVNGGWAVASRQLYHERTAVGGGSPYTSGTRTARAQKQITPLEVARSLGRITDPAVRALVGEWLTVKRVQDQLVARVGARIADGTYPVAAASMMRLGSAESSQHTVDITVRVAGSGAAVGRPESAEITQQVARGVVMRQGSSLGGGSTEISRNILSERFLGMPREWAADKGLPFNQIRRNSPS